jgi:iron complex outermembrane receptor protein
MLLAGAIARTGFAQTTATTVANGDSLEEIVVTAQKRSENVQDTPLSVGAYSGQALLNANITQLRDVSQMDSSLQINGNSGITSVFVRGLGNDITTLGNEQSVAVYIDDVYYTDPATVYQDLANLDHVEVLKGPQGTLFGRNASAGVVSIYTRDPSMDAPTVEGAIGWSSYNTPYTRVYGSMPLSSTLATDVSISARDQNDGWGRNLTTGLPDYLDKSISLRSKTVWAPTDTFKVKAIVYYVDQHTEQFALDSYFRGTRGGGLDSSGIITTPPYADRGFYNTLTDRNQYSVLHSFGGSVRVDYEMPFANFTSISAARTLGGINYYDGDNTQVNISDYNLNIVDQQFSQEFQLKSKPGSTVSWIGGLYYLNYLQGYRPTQITGDDYGPVSIDITGYQRLSSYAPYGQATIPLFYETNLTAGLRYTVDKLNAVGITAVNIPDTPTDVSQNITPSTKFDKLTYKGAIDHHFTKDVMGYVSYGLGFKAGTYNTLPLDPTPLKPEINEATEIGLKSEFLGQRVRVNTAVFRNNLKDPQVQEEINGFAININAGSARSQGAEFQVDAAVAEGLKVHLAATYLDAKFLNFPNDPYYTQRPTGGLAVSSADASDHVIPDASKWKFVAGLNYEFSVPLGKFDTDLNAVYTGAFPWSADNVVWENATTIVNASLAFTPGSQDHLSYAVWVKNLTNVEYYSFVYEEAGTAGFASHAAPPRTIGAEVRFKY